MSTQWHLHLQSSDLEQHLWLRWNCSPMAWLHLPSPLWCLLVSVPGGVGIRIIKRASCTMRNAVRRQLKLLFCPALLCPNRRDTRRKFRNQGFGMGWVGGCGGRLTGLVRGSTPKTLTPGACRPIFLLRASLTSASPRSIGSHPFKSSCRTR